MGQTVTCISPIDGSLYAERDGPGADDAAARVQARFADLVRARTQEAVSAQLGTGTVFMNRADYLGPALCWTGYKDTGRGGGLSVIGYHNLTRPKSYHLRKLP